MLGTMLLAWLWATSADAAVTATDPITAGLLQRAEYEYAAISPTGTYLAVAHRQGAGTTVEILRRADGQLATHFVPTSRGEVGGMTWLGPEKLLVSASRSAGPYPMPRANPWLFLITVGEKYAQQLPANVASLIEGDDGHLIIRRCHSGRLDPCHMELRRVPLDHVTGSGDFIATVPAQASELSFDHTGYPRFALSVADDASQRFYVYRQGDWSLLNDSDKSDTFISAIGVSRDNRAGFLVRENRQGPNTVVRYDFASGAMTDLLQDAQSDPLIAISSLDGEQPIGAVFGPGVPRERYWDMDSDDSRWRRAVSAAFPGESVAVLNATRDGALAVIKVSSDRDPGTFYLFDRHRAKADLLFHSMPWLDPAQQLPSQPIAFKARDGLALTGFMTLPRGHAGTPGPMVVMVHGGPYYLRADWAFDPVVQLLAQHGYAVLRVNFRGSFGAGHAFIQAGVRQWGAAMQDDITDGTRWAIAEGVADPHRICIFGASYGAYSAMMGAAREPSLYRCAIGLSGVYDLNRLYRWGDTHRSDLGDSYLRRMVGADPQALARVSPTQLAHQITLPVLLGHGTDDPRAPISHAKAMQDALRAAGNPAHLLIYRYEGHGLSGYEDNLDFYSHMLQFLDVHTSKADQKPSAPD